ncbi:MAG: hypothetical protein WBD34_18835 [Burkholderiaceae bacterium]
MPSLPTLPDFARTLLKIRETRAKQEAGPPPRLHGFIHYDRFRMRVTSNPSAEYWNWLTLAGWRENRFPRDRRDYVDLPEATFAELAQRSSASREETYLKLMRERGA